MRTLPPGHEEIHRELTELWIGFAPSLIAPTRREGEPDGAGGTRGSYEPVAGTSADPEVIDGRYAYFAGLTPVARQGVFPERRISSDGSIRTSRYLLIAKSKEDIRKFDRFELRGEEMEITFVHPVSDWALRAEVTVISEDPTSG